MKREEVVKKLAEVRRKRDEVGRKRSHHVLKRKMAPDAPRMTMKAGTGEPRTATMDTSVVEPDEDEEEDEIEREFGVVAVCSGGRQILMDMLMRRREKEAEAAAANSTSVRIEHQSRQSQERKMALELDDAKKRTATVLREPSPISPPRDYPTLGPKFWFPSPPHADDKSETLAVNCGSYQQWRNKFRTSTPKDKTTTTTSPLSPMCPMSPIKVEAVAVERVSLANTFKTGWSLLDEKTTELPADVMSDMLDEKTAELLADEKPDEPDEKPDELDEKPLKMENESEE